MSNQLIIGFGNKLYFVDGRNTIAGCLFLSSWLGRSFGYVSDLEIIVELFYFPFP